MAALKATGWGVGLAIAGVGLGFLYTTLFPGDNYGGLEDIAPIMVGLFLGATTGVVASITATLRSRGAAAADGRAMALAMIAPPVILAAFAAMLQVLRFGVDIIPASLLVGVASGLATGTAWAFAKSRGMRANPMVATAVWVVLTATAWLLGTVLGAGTGNENSLHPELFLYLTMILPLQVAAPVSAAVLPPKSAVSSA